MFFPFFIAKDILGVLIIFFSFLYMVFFMPNYLVILIILLEQIHWLHLHI